MLCMYYAFFFTFPGIQILLVRDWFQFILPNGKFQPGNIYLVFFT